MIEKLLRHPYLVHQRADDENDIPEMPIAVCSDVSGRVCLSQENHSIVLNRASVKELFLAIRKTMAEHDIEERKSKK